MAQKDAATGQREYKSQHYIYALLGSALMVMAPAVWSDASAQGKGRNAESHNMRLVGFNDLQARSAYQPIIQQQGGRWIAYVGHHNGEALNPLTGAVETNGVSIVDVTNPRRPVYLHHLPAEAGGSQMVQTCLGDDLPNGAPGTVYLLRTNGNFGHEIWDVTDPANPTFVVTVIDGLNGTHKNWWECDTGIAYLVSDLRPFGWQTRRGLQVFDLSDPSNPVLLRNFAIPELAPGSTAEPPFPGEGGIHEATSSYALVGEDGARVYLAYGTGSNGLVQILDRTRLIEGNPDVSDPFEPTAENLLYPEIGRLEMPTFWGGHTAWPLLGVEVAEFEPWLNGSPRDFLVVTSESTDNMCLEDMHHMSFFADITDPANPFPVSNYHVEESEGEFCDRGGRFGTHSQNWSYTPVFYKKLVFYSYFNAGVRAVDVRNPYHPEEVAYFIPATTPNTDERCADIDGDDVDDVCKVAIQTNNVEVDDRGLIYLADRANTGLHIVQLTGDAKKIADLP